MKKHITQATINVVAQQLAQARRDYKENADNPQLQEYFYGKAFGIIDTFSTLSGQSWTSAEAMLTKRGA